MRYLILALMSITFAFAPNAVAGDAKPLPPEAQKAVDAMEVQINKARQECLVKLNKCIMDITKTGNLEAAMVVKAKETEIMDAMPHVDLFGDANGVVGKWIVGGNPSWIHEYKADGTVTSQTGSVGKWMVKNNQLVVVWGNSTTLIFILPVKNNTLYNVEKNGASNIMTKVVAK